MARNAESWAGSTRLRGKVAVVAGASTGIGRVTALRLAGEGARLIVGSPAHESALLDDLVEAIGRAGGEALAQPFDATDDATVAALVDRAITTYGRLDAVHANFADLRLLRDDSDVLDVTDDLLDRTLDVGLKGMVRITRHAVPKLLEQGGGAMIYTSSIASIEGEPVRPCYAMAKSGLNALVRHCAARWGREGLRANAIMPGYVVTAEMQARGISQSFLDQVLRTGHSPRVGRAEDIAAMVALLASQDGEWINGQCIAIDGGKTMR